MSLQNHLCGYHKHLLAETLGNKENFIHGFLIFHTEHVYAATDEILQFIKNQFNQYTILRSSEVMKEYWHPSQGPYYQYHGRGGRSFPLSSWSEHTMYI